MNSNRSITLMLTLAVGLMTAGSTASAAQLVIANASFENPALGEDNWVYGVANWTTIGSPSRGTWHCGTQYGAKFTPPEAPDGNNVIWLRGGSLSQTLTDVLANRTCYDLSAMFGQRYDLAFPPGAALELWAGSTKLAGYDLDNEQKPTAGHWVTATTSYTSTANDPLAGEPLSIRLVAGSSTTAEAQIDKISLETTPVPEGATLGLLALGGLLSVLRRRR